MRESVRSGARCEMRCGKHCRNHDAGPRHPINRRFHCTMRHMRRYLSKLVALLLRIWLWLFTVSQSQSFSHVVSLFLSWLFQRTLPLPLGVKDLKLFFPYISFIVAGHIIFPRKFAPASRGIALPVQTFSGIVPEWWVNLMPGWRTNTDALDNGGL